MNQQTLSIIFTLLLSGCGNLYDEGSVYISTDSRNPCEHKPDIGNIKIDCTLDSDKYSLISNDLKQLESLYLFGSSALQLRRTLNLSNTSGNTLKFWLEERVKFIFAEDFQSSSTRRSTAAINIGSMYARRAKRLGQSPYILNLPGHTQVKVDSHQAGAIQLGPAFFSDEYPSEWNIERAQTILRLGVLIHEARHSDDDGFPHIRCPDTHPTRPQELACDQSSHGSYGIEYLFLKSAHESCHECTDFEKDIIQIDFESIENNLILN